MPKVTILNPDGPSDTGLVSDEARFFILLLILSWPLLGLFLSVRKYRRFDFVMFAYAQVIGEASMYDGVHERSSLQL